jgi:hypothetical protein
MLVVTSRDIIDIAYLCERDYFRRSTRYRGRDWLSLDLNVTRMGHPFGGSRQ